MNSWFRVLRPLLLGILLTPFCCFWSQDQGIDRIFSLMVPPVALTMVVAVLNIPFRRVLPRIALSGAEIIILYAMLAVACAMSGEWMDMFAPQIYGFGAYSETNAQYRERLLPVLSDLLFLKDPAALKDFRDGGKSFAFFLSQLPLWWPKIGAWTAFITLLSTAMLCINALLREQWIYQEKLSFPIVQIPLAIADAGGPNSVWKSRLLWTAFVLVFTIDMINGFSILYPQIPTLKIRFLDDLNRYFTSPPMNQTGWTPIGIFPYMSALGFFMPTDLLFSLLFFFFVRKITQIFAYILGNEQGVFGGGGLFPSPPYFSEQSWGAFAALFLSGMWLARPHWKKIGDAIFLNRTDDLRPNGLSYRFVALLLAFCLFGLGMFGLLIGLPFEWVLFYIGLYLIFSIAVTRLRAQLGAPTHEMAFMGPHQMVIDFNGTAGLNQALVARTMTTFHIMNRLHRTHPQPTLLEAQYLADRVGMSQGVIFGALIIAIIFGTVCGCLTHIYLGYRWTPNPWVAGEVSGIISQIQGTPRAPNPFAMLAVALGFGVVLLLDFIRFRVPGFWLHPAGYALAMNFGVDYYWFGLLIVLIIKFFVQRYYGLKGTLKLRELAIGLVTGEFTAELIWAVYSMLNDRQLTYSISINGKMGWDQ
ncbi:MAG: DUF6785 family protein [Capsulimonadales bacterium]|nr:DUF6785 family protein [Capsulimonadales bacterium]